MWMPAAPSLPNALFEAKMILLDADAAAKPPLGFTATSIAQLAGGRLRIIVHRARQYQNMSELERYRARREEEEQEKKYNRKLRELCEEQAERVRAFDGYYHPWLVAIVILLLLTSFLYTAYSTYRNLQKPRPAVPPPAAAPAQGQPPQNTKPKRRASRQATTPAPERK
jgi:cytochrome c-type biogenesis protein CcmH/NrfG